MPDNYTFENGYLWKVDGNGNKIQTTERPLDADTVIMNITQRQTGDSIPVKSSRYKYYIAPEGYNKDVSDEYKVYKTGRDLQKEAKDYILSRPNVFGTLTSKDLDSEEVKKRLFEQQYSNSVQALALQNYYYPVLEKKYNGKLYLANDNKLKKYTYIDGCNDCGGGGVEKEGTFTKQGTKVEWEELWSTRIGRPKINEFIGYKEYQPEVVNDTSYIAGYLPASRIEEKTLETKKPQPSKPTTKTTKATSIKPHMYKPPVLTTSKPAKQETNETIKWEIVYNPFTGEEIGRKEIKKHGGNLNYFDYFK